MKILLVGGHGFIGGHVLDRLMVRQPAGMLPAVHIIDSLESQVHGGNKVSCRVGDAKLPTEPYDVVVHLGAKVGVGQSMYDPAGYVECNSLDTAKFLANLTRCKPKRLVVASSMSVYGEGANHRLISRCGDNPVGDEPAPTPEWKAPDLRSIYALTKYDQEQLCLIWGAAHGVPTVALRFFNVYGPGQALTNPYTGVMAIFATRLLNGKQPVIYEDGQQSRDFVNVEDVADAVVHAALQPEGVEHGIYNVGTGIPRTVEQVALDLAKNLGVDIKPHVTGQKRAGDIRHCYADISKIRSTGWAPRVAWEVGVRRYCKWLQEQPVPEDRWEEAAQELQSAGLVAGGGVAPPTSWL